jgi:hypothetical protein
MEELVNKLANLQAKMKSVADEIAADTLIEEYTAAIIELEEHAAEGRKERDNLVAAYGQDLLKIEIDGLKDQILDEWDGEKKTIKYDFGTISFRTTKNLNIVDGRRLLGHMVANMPIDKIADEYLKGFLLTPTRAYVTVHGLGEGIAKIDEKTSVSFKSG